MKFLKWSQSLQTLATPPLSTTASSTKLEPWPRKIIFKVKRVILFFKALRLLISGLFDLGPCNFTPAYVPKVRRLAQSLVLVWPPRAEMEPNGNRLTYKAGWYEGLSTRVHQSVGPSTYHGYGVWCQVWFESECYEPNESQKANVQYPRRKYSKSNLFCKVPFLKELDTWNLRTWFRLLFWAHETKTWPVP